MADIGIIILYSTCDQSSQIFYNVKTNSKTTTSVSAPLSSSVCHVSVAKQLKHSTCCMNMRLVCKICWRIEVVYVRFCRLHMILSKEPAVSTKVFLLFVVSLLGIVLSCFPASHALTANCSPSMSLFSI